MLIVDGHADIAWNALAFGRDYTQITRSIRERERGTDIPSRNGNTLLGRDAWLEGQVAVIFATLYESPMQHRLGEWDVLAYRTPQEAYRIAGLQLDLYHRLSDEGKLFRVIGTQKDLADVLATWDPTDEATEEDERRIGLIPLMEGADPIIEPPQVEEWRERGVRIVGPAWKGTRYAGGTGEPGPLTRLGFELLDIMGGLEMILDLSHMAEQAFFQAVESYDGVMIASHSNPRRFFPDRIKDRGLSDDMLAALAERGGVIGVVPYNRFLNPDAQPGDPKDSVHLTTVVEAIDYICQITGSADHVAMGTDFDGGFGLELAPAEIDTIADLQKLIPLLEGRGYSPSQIEGFMGGNWLRILRRSLPD